MHEVQGIALPKVAVTVTALDSGTIKLHLINFEQAECTSQKSTQLHLLNVWGIN